MEQCQLLLGAIKAAVVEALAPGVAREGDEAFLSASGQLGEDSQLREIELVQFGLMPQFIGQGLGKWFLQWTIDKA